MKLLTADFTDNCNAPLSLLYTSIKRRTINFDDDDDDDDDDDKNKVASFNWNTVSHCCLTHAIKSKIL